MSEALNDRFTHPKICRCWCSQSDGLNYFDFICDAGVPSVQMLLPNGDLIVLQRSSYRLRAILLLSCISLGARKFDILPYLNALLWQIVSLDRISGDKSHVLKKRIVLTDIQQPVASLAPFITYQFKRISAVWLSLHWVDTNEVLAASGNFWFFVHCSVVCQISLHPFVFLVGHWSQWKRVE